MFGLFGGSTTRRQAEDDSEEKVVINEASNNSNNNVDCDNTMTTNNCTQQQNQLDTRSSESSGSERKRITKKVTSTRRSSESTTNNEVESRLRDEQSSRKQQNSIHFKEESKPQKQATLHKTRQNNFPIKDHLLLTASDFKTAGNKLCALFRYDEAIIYYTKAISKNPDVSIFYSNRALCHLKLQQYSQAIQDCRKALDLETDSIKAHFFLGQALAESNNYDEALKHLQRANELAKEGKLNFGDDITYQIRSVKRRKWNKIEDDSVKFEDELQNYLIELIIKDREAKLLEFQERYQSKMDNTDNSWQPTPSSSTVTVTPYETILDNDLPNSIEKEESNIRSKCDNYMSKLKLMFNDLEISRKKREVPDYLCGKISFEIMRDPVITPSGITYDRQDIEEHFKRVGHFDPLTRSPLEASQLISNLAMKEVVDAYVRENEWALYY